MPNTGAEKRVIKKIRIDIDKCIGCRACEVACSGFHAKPRYSSVNPARSRMRVIFDEYSDVYIPLRATAYTLAECPGRHRYTIRGKDHKECSFCGVCCPSREYFYEPDSGLPLRCDMCESVPPLSEPVCVQVCRVGALTYEEVEEEAPAEREPVEELEMGLETLASEYGLDKVIEVIARMSQKE